MLANMAEQAGRPPHLLRRQDTTMSRKPRPERRRSQLGEVRHVTVGAVISTFVRFLLDQLRDLLW